MNLSIVIALKGPEDAKRIRGILQRHGIVVTEICTSGAGALACMSGLEGGILICGYRFADLYYREILEAKPDTFDMILLASESAAAEARPAVTAIGLPFTGAELARTVNESMEGLRRRLKKSREGPKKRDPRDQLRITEAKARLLDTNNWTEEQAHRYLQKSSMDYGRSMAETADMLLMLLQ